MKMIVDNYGERLGAIVGTALGDVASGTVLGEISGGWTGAKIGEYLTKATVSTLETFEKNASIARCIVERARAGTH